MSESMYDLKQDAIKEFRDRLQDAITDGDLDIELPDDFEPHDIIFEVADSQTPIWNSTLLDLAAKDNDIALNAPEIGPAFDGVSPTPVNIIAANVFEALESALWDYWRELVDEGIEVEIEFTRRAFEGLGL